MQLTIDSTPYSGYVVVAILVPTSSSSIGSLDPLSSTEMDISQRNYFASVGMARVATTDPSGIATFANLNVMDIYGDTGCFKLMFAVGEPTNYTISDVSTDELCFKNNYIIQLYSNYSTHIAPNQPFYKPVTLLV